MSIFEYVAAALLLVAGLGITQLLSDAVDTFRGRQKINLHWIPLSWIVLVFVWQMQFIWAIFELNDLIKSWTAFDFIILLLMALFLFVAGALVVPKVSEAEGPNAWEQFLQDGRWSLVCLSCFFLLAFFTNPLLFDVQLLLPSNMLDFLLGVLLIFAQFTQSKKIWAWVTIAFASLSILTVVVLSPAAYQ